MRLKTSQIIKQLKEELKEELETDVTGFCFLTYFSVNETCKHVESNDVFILNHKQTKEIGCFSFCAHKAC